MIELYTWKTPNGRRASIMLEELGLPYTVHAVNLQEKAQFAAGFEKVSPSNKIPAMVDSDGPDGPISVFESGAILTYLAEKTGRLLPASGVARYETLEWFNWLLTGLVPMLGQFTFFAVISPEKVPAAIARYSGECERMFGVLERRLAVSAYIGGAEYSVVDVAAYPWLHFATTFAGEALAGILADKPALHEWIARIGERPAVKAGMLVPAV